MPNGPIGTQRRRPACRGPDNRTYAVGRRACGHTGMGAERPRWSSSAEDGLGRQDQRFRDGAMEVGPDRRGLSVAAELSAQLHGQPGPR